MLYIQGCKYNITIVNSCEIASLLLTSKINHKYFYKYYAEYSLKDRKRSGKPQKINVFLSKKKKKKVNRIIKRKSDWISRELLLKTIHGLVN